MNAEGWSTEDESRLIELRRQGMSWIDIAKEINRTTTSSAIRTGDGCSGRYRRLLPAEQRKRIHNTGERWTKEDETRLEELLRQFVKPRDIAAILGKKPRSIYNKIQYMRNPVLSIKIEPSLRPEPSPDLLDDRDRRAMAGRSLTAYLLGDPPRGWSALDKRQEAFA